MKLKPLRYKTKKKGDDLYPIVFRHKVEKHADKDPVAKITVSIRGSYYQQNADMLAEEVLRDMFNIHDFYCITVQNVKGQVAQPSAVALASSSDIFGCVPNSFYSESFSFFDPPSVDYPFGPKITSNFNIRRYIKEYLPVMVH